MNTNLNEALTDAVRRWARPTTPDELKRRGVARVRSVSLARVAMLIEKAVNRTMLARTLDDGPNDVESFSEATREEFIRMMSEGGPQYDPIQNHAANELQRLRGELARRRLHAEAEERALQEEASGFGPDADELATKLRRVFASWGGSIDSPSPMEREVIEVAVQELHTLRLDAREAQLERYRREIDVLERRISKLMGALGDTEGELARVKKLKLADAGIASIYDAVQGLDEDDLEFRRKAQLMTAIFEANVEMRDTLRV